MNLKAFTKKLVDSIPGLPRLLWRLRHPDQAYPGSYNLTRLRRALPEACQQVRPFVQSAAPGKQVFIFGTLHYWIEEGTLIGLALAGLGHKVTFAYLPYAKYHLPLNPADLRSQDRYTRSVLKPARKLIEVLSMLQVRSESELPSELDQAVQKTSAFDVEYVFQTEEADTGSDLYAMRLQRNRQAARAALAWFTAHRPDVAIIPNGMILELGAVYQAARYLDIPVVTYEFNEKREQLWLSQDDEVMRQTTDALWQARGHLPLTDEQRAIVEAMEAARQGAKSFGNSERRWQEVPLQGSSQARASLGLDSRPVVLLTTNVLGDSLILGRNIFTQSMAEWVSRTVQYFAKRTDVQLVVRIHPGEKYARGTTAADVVTRALPAPVENIHLIKALDNVNTYDLMRLSDLGLVFVTTAGLEMVMNGMPVVVAGETHYCKRGFTFDPRTWDEYYAMLDSILADPGHHRPSREQVDAAWNYAYRFFFEYPRPFPWRLISFWEDFEKWPLARLLSGEGQVQFGRTFGYLTGEPLDWKEI